MVAAKSESEANQMEVQGVVVYPATESLGTRKSVYEGDGKYTLLKVPKTS
jgi:hypothetical protein